MSVTTGPAENWATLWEAIAARQPEHVAVVVGDHRLTWRSLDDRAARLANALDQRGIGADAKVAQLMFNCPEYLESSYAAFKVRASTVNVNYRYRAAEIVHVASDSGARALFFHGAFADVVDEARRSLPELTMLVQVEDGDAAELLDGAVRYEDLIADNEPAKPVARSGSDELLLYTGGTTGSPKGVVWRHDDLFTAMAFAGYAPLGIPVPSSASEVGEIAARLNAAGSSPVNMTAPPLMHGTALFLAMSTFVLGGTVVLLAGRRFDPAELLRLIEREHVTQLSIVGDAFARPIVTELQRAESRAIDHPCNDHQQDQDHDHDHDHDHYDITSLTRIMSTGATLSSTYKRELMKRATRATVVDMIGASEGGPFAMAMTLPGTDPVATAKFTATPVTALFDPDTWQPIERGSGVEGVLAATGPIPLGYYRDPTKTAATFRTIGGIRYSIPGDHAVIDLDGTVHLLGRGSVCINSGGEKVYPEEVEVVARRFAGVEDCVVVGVADDRFGEIVVLVASLTPGTSTDERSIIDHVSSQLASYKAPRRVVIVDHFYRSPSGKADYRWARNVAETTLAIEQGPEAPCSQH